MADIEKNYKNNEITVRWKPGLCIHSTHCWKGLLNVFDPRKKPWVNMEGADSESIIHQVNQCPSGALSWKKNDSTDILNSTENEPENTVEIIVTKNGSLKVLGKVIIKDEEGNLLHTGEKTFLCRCGHSAKKPFCDSSHKRVGFAG